MKGYLHKEGCNCGVCTGESGFQKGDKRFIGKNNHMFGLDRRGKCSWVSERNKKYVGEKNPMFGKHLTLEQKKKISENKERAEKISKKLKGRKNFWMLGKNHPLFNNWSSLCEYDIEFNNDFKEKIRNRDGRICMFCGIKENLRKLSIHHIDFNKKHTENENCISLCISCHSATNYNKIFFKNFFQDMLNHIYGYNIGTKMLTQISSPKLNNYNEMETFIYNNEW